MNTHSGFTVRPILATRIAATACGAALALLVVSSALAGDAAKEVKTAAQHAELAAASDNLAGVYMHLHHTLNCLVGPDGVSFDADAMNPCESMGNGAIPDSADDTAKQALQEAVREAESGLSSQDLASAQQAARNTSEMLQAHDM